MVNLMRHMRISGGILANPARDATRTNTGAQVFGTGTTRTSSANVLRPKHACSIHLASSLTTTPSQSTNQGAFSESWDELCGIKAAPLE